MSDDVLDAIGRALTDHGTSLDAMRWVPEPAPELELEWFLLDAFRDTIARSVGGDMEGAALDGIESPPPDDPRTRALAARQSRNVGPDGRTPAGRKRRT